MVSIKHDNGKTRWDLIPFKALESIADVLAMGANKYGENNWQSLNNYEDRYFAAAMRHLIAWREGDKYDYESMLSHLAHAATNIIFLLHKELEDENR